MAEAKTSGDGKTSPFGNGQGATAAGASGGGHDFTTDPKSSGAGGGGRDFTKESRPQTEAKVEVIPNAQEIPAGGKVLRADPGPVSRAFSGTAAGVSPPKPFKLRG